MEIALEPGVYIVAVSGGVDSMVLLHALTTKYKLPATSFIVAHVDHGIRSDSAKDASLVADTASRYGLQYEQITLKLGPSASEDTARKARYEFLQAMAKKYSADAIITAHHQDDLLETVIMQMLRGSGRRVFSSLRTSAVLRPLLAYSKQDILAYAKQHKVKWNEDSTNAEDIYLRNHIRHHLLPKLTVQQRKEFLKLIDEHHVKNQETDGLLQGLCTELFSKGKLKRQFFCTLPHALCKEIISDWLRRMGYRDFDRKTIERLVVAVKTSRSGSVVKIGGGIELLLSKTYAEIRPSG